MEEVNVTFKEPMHRIVDRIKNESYFRWPNKMGGDLSRRNQNLYCTYHKDKGHTTEQCRMLKDHLEQLVKARIFERVHSGPKESRSRAGYSASGESSSTPIGSDRGHPRSFKGYMGVQ